MQLVILAAGMGSRFGGLKQMEKMDEAGNFLLDYSVYDAKRAGFDSVVFIIKKEFYKEFKESIGKRVERLIKVDYAFQELDDLPEGFKVPEGREKPWGTAHAIYAARNLVKEDFIIINKYKESSFDNWYFSLILFPHCINSLIFLYGGNQINMELKFKEQANLMDINRKEMKVLVYKKENDDFTCPHCNAKINFNTEKIDNLCTGK